MLTQNLQLCVGASLEKEVGSGGCVSGLPPVVFAHVERQRDKTNTAQHTITEDIKTNIA